MQNRLNANALGLSIAFLSGLCMLILGIFGLLGIYEGAVTMMEEVHLFFSVDALGIIFGIIEGAVWGYILGGLIGVFYNWFVPEA